MSSVFRVVGGVFVLLFLGIILREVGFKGVRLIGLIGVLGIVGAGIFTVEYISVILGGIGQGSADEYIVTVMKILGIGYISGLCADVCMEFGEIALSNAVLLFGKAEMLLISVPSAVSIIEKGIELI